MKIKETILAVLTAIGAFFSAVFFVLLKQSKINNKELEEGNLQLKEDFEKIKTIVDIKREFEDDKKEKDIKTESVIDDYCSGNMSASSILSDLAENSRNRNH